MTRGFIAQKKINIPFCFSLQKSIKGRYSLFYRRHDLNREKNEKIKGIVSHELNI